MFHQANVVSTSWTGTGNLAVDPVPSGNPSLLEYWYQRVLAQMAKFINTSAFPIKVRNMMVPTDVGRSLAVSGVCLPHTLHVDVQCHFLVGR